MLPSLVLNEFYPLCCRTLNGWAKSFIRFGNRLKSEDVKYGELGWWGMSSNPRLWIVAITTTKVYAWALSWWNITPFVLISSLFSLIYYTAASVNQHSIVQWWCDPSRNSPPSRHHSPPTKTEAITFPAETVTLAFFEVEEETCFHCLDYSFISGW